MQRVLVLGCSGSGKSTFAVKLAGLTGLTTVSLDGLFWQPGWQRPHNDAFGRLVETAAREPSWIMDGDYLVLGAADVRAARADTVFWLDLPRRVCLARVVKRTTRDYGRVRPEMPPDCPERINMEFLSYVWNYSTKYRPRVAEFVSRMRPDQSLFHFTGRADADRFLSQYAASCAPAGA